MATESLESEEEGKITGGNQHLMVEDDLREMGKIASCKPGNGVSYLRDDNVDTYWQSDGAQPHLVNIQFQKKVKLQLVALYVDFQLDESYTSSKISVRSGKPLSIPSCCNLLAVLSNHLNGRDTHLRQIKVYRNPIPHQPFQFTSIEFFTYSTVRGETFDPLDRSDRAE